MKRRLGKRLGGVELGQPHELAQHRLLPLDQTGDELVDHRWNVHDSSSDRALAASVRDKR